MAPYQHTNEAEMFAGFDRHAAKKEAQNIFESTPSDGAAISDLAEGQLRSAAMSLVLAWVAMGDFSYAAFEASAAGMADFDENESLDDDEEAYLNDLLQAAADALVSAGADSANVASFLDDESDEAGAALGELLASKMEGVTQSDEDLIAGYATSGSLILEGAIKVIRNGVVTLKKKRIGIPKRMNSLQKAALKKARSRAFTGAAKAARKKSLRIHRRMGI